MISKKAALGLAVILIAYIYSRQSTDELDNKEQSIIEAWNSSIVEPYKQFKKIAIGINCNLDLIVPGIKLLEDLGQKPGQKLDSVTIENLEDLTNTFTHYYTKGAAAERNFVSKDVYQKIVETAAKIDGTQRYVGGNAALMAVKISQLFPQTQVQLVGPIGPGLRELLPGLIHIPKDSIIDNDEVHLIMEYSLKDSWDGLQTPVANRFITSYDESNSRLTMLGNYFTSLEKFQPDLVLLGGLHLIETQTLDYIRDKFVEVKNGLAKVPTSVPIHLELASMANPDCVKLILDEVIPSVNSLGLNEQELSFSSYVLDGPHSEEFMHRKGQPEIHKISDMVLWMLQKYGYSKLNKGSKLTRIHFHSLTYHIVGIVPESWHNSKSAIAAGTRMAGRQACGSQSLSPDDLELRIPLSFKMFSGDQDRYFDEKNPVISWVRDDYKFHFSPVLVCKSPLKTVGLGDAISSTGLMYSEFNSDFLTSFPSL